MDVDWERKVWFFFADVICSFFFFLDRFITVTALSAEHKEIQEQSFFLNHISFIIYPKKKNMYQKEFKFKFNINLKNNIVGEMIFSHKINSCQIEVTENEKYKILWSTHLKT